MRFGSEEDLVRILKYPAASIACDCGATLNTRQHPRAWGSFPRVLGRYVREQHVLTWEDAIRKMTALPANTIGMIDRGFIAPGMAADITVFDPNTVIDRATYEDPAQLSEGIRDVIVNGVVALRNGKPTGERGGRVLARSPHMPSRPMNGITTARRFASRGAMADGRRITIDLAQAAGAPRATGTFRLLDVHGAAVIEAATLGVLQTMKGWTSITGVARSQPGGALRPFTAVVEQADPFVAGTPRTLSVEVPGQPVVTGVLR
ncbi:MAG: amidohydrolase family protein [Acidobacteria bacterium]|nr:amidohydrolase family protein [Acidobacteriota bacterium]